MDEIQLKIVPLQMHYQELKQCQIERHGRMKYDRAVDKQVNAEECNI